MITTDQIEELRVKFGRVGVVNFEKHIFVFQQPNDEHARFWRRASTSAATSVDATDQLAVQLIVAFDDMICPELGDRPNLRMAFRNWLKTRPLAVDNAWFGPVLAELLGQTEEGTAERAGKGCSVSSDTPTTSD
jgi:hypothetical protein